MAHLEFDIEKIRENNNLIFQEAVNKFFWMNPEDKYEILFLLYFAKRHWLKVVENGSYDDGYVIETFDRDDYNADGILKEGVSSVSARLYIPDEFKKEHEDFIRYFDASAAQRAHKFTSPYIQDNNVFNKSRYEKTYILDICEDFTSLSEYWYKYDSHDAFNYILLRIAGSLRKGEYLTQPLELTKLVLEILDAKEGTVYNPFSGCCSYAANSTVELKYVGQEINEMTYLLGRLNIMFNDKHNCVCLHEDSVTNWRGNENFDFIVSTPPFGVRISEGKKRKRLEPEILKRSAQDCKKKAVVVLPVSVCFTKSSEMLEVRKTIIENDWLDSVIRLPEKTLFGTMIPVFLFVINKDKNKKGVVRFVDASDKFTSQRFRKIINVDEVMALYNGSDEIGKVCDITIDEIRDNDYNLSPNFYINKEWLDSKTIHNIVYLKDILMPLKNEGVHICEGSYKRFSTNENNNTRVIHASKLTDSEHEDALLKKVINEDCLVFDSLIISNLVKYKPNYYYLKTEGHNVIFDNIFDKFFKLDVKSVYPEYLVKEFEKEYFLKQIEMYGDSLISEGKLLDCFVILPPFDKQQSSVIESRLLDLDGLELKYRDEYRDKLYQFECEMHNKKHELLNMIQYLIDSTDLIHDCISDNDETCRTMVTNPKFGTTLPESIDRLSQNLDKVSNFVKELIPKERFGNEEIVELNKFLSDYTTLNDKNKFYRSTYISCEEESFLNVSISASELNTILNNLFSNAIEYGFIDKDRKDYEIRVYTNVDVIEGRKLIEIKVSNNGIPVSDSFPIEKLFVRNMGHGTGTGCSQARDIARHFGGDLNYNEDLKDIDGFASEFVITLPLI